MAKLKKLPGLRVIDGFKGVVDFYVYMGVPCARKWPRSPGKIRSPDSMWQWQVLADAARLWRELSPEVKAAYDQMAVSGRYTGRDVFVRAYIHGHLAIEVKPDALENEPRPP